jgi:type II secretion system protein C
VSVTPLALVLTGTHQAIDPRDSAAFIGVDPRYPQTYAAGALLANGARLAHIGRDHVLLERDGKRVRLDIGGVIKADLAVSGNPLRFVGGGEQPDSQLPSPSVETVTDYLRLEPVFSESGQFAGYRLHPAPHAAVFQQWALEPGDLLIEVNGALLSDADSAAAMLQMVAAGQRLPATVIRDGTRTAVTLDGATIERSRTGQEQTVIPVIEPPT